MGSIKDVNIMSLFQGEKYTYLLDEFGEEKIINRFNTLYDYLDTFIDENELSDKVYISVILLEQVVVDYFVDIFRLKKFHHIEKINDNKIHAYTAYWLAKEKVIQILPSEETDQRLTAVNEWMVTSYLISYLLSEKGKSIILNENNIKAITEIKENLLYSLRYRNFSPNMFETILVAFSAGRSWQYSLDYID